MRHIGIFTNEHDPHWHHVEQALSLRGLPFRRFDRSDFPAHLRLTARIDPSQDWRIVCEKEGGTYFLDSFRSIWYRRPGRYRFPEGLPAAALTFAEAEAAKGYGGLLRGLSCLWVSHPDALTAVEWKPRQLHAARQQGLRIPKTLITNDPRDALDFVDECEQVIYKPLSHGYLGSDEQGTKTIYTTLLPRSKLVIYGPDVATTATLLQEFIPKVYDVRVTVIGRQVFATEIHTHGEQPLIDWRRDYSRLTYHVHQLPTSLEQACIRLVEAFNLQFSAIDFVVTPEGEYVFLEQNGNGQWLWLERETGQPMTEALIDLLDSVT